MMTMVRTIPVHREPASTWTTGQGAAGTERPAIDFVAAGGVDLGRLERSLWLHGERLGNGRYRVSGGSSDHWVDLYTTTNPRCDCGDHLWRDRVCKHILAALLREGHESVITALPRLIQQVRSTPPKRARQTMKAA